MKSKIALVVLSQVLLPFLAHAQDMTATFKCEDASSGTHYAVQINDPDLPYYTIYKFDSKGSSVAFEQGDLGNEATMDTVAKGSNCAKKGYSFRLSSVMSGNYCCNEVKED